MAWEPATQPAPFHFRAVQPTQPVQQSPTSNLDFLHYDPGNKADLTVFVPGTEGSFTFRNLDHDAIAQSCPLLGHSFEDRGRGLHHSMEATSVELIARFLRFLHTGDYITFDKLGREEPCSLLLHAELCRLADLFDINTLKVQAHYNVVRTTEIACSSPRAPEDLVPAIRFIYEQLSDGYEKIIDTVLHYCISCFLQHGLGHDVEFTLLAYEVRQFHTDLCRTNFKRGFEDEGASDVIQLRTKEVCQSEQLRIEQTALGDFLYFMHSETPTATPRFGPTPGSPEPSYTMVIRPRHPTGRAKIDERDVCSDSEVEGFSLVDSSNHPLHIPYRPALAKKPPVKEPVDVPFEEWAEFQDVDEWQNVDAYPKPGMYRQLDLADSSATIKPMAVSSAATRMQATIEEEDSLGYDSEWSVIDNPVVKAVSFA
ncbi:hypothetical protein EG328_004889 [Venturia inaequalis]|uniref:BTB domain-containing protein n=1 Tax=Venturia inaequalis TaxID=5025 RepID=A0A8H3UL44_VENIN|nr:hypothetical protein EG328_004889 [Venturia inaequalis]